MRNKKITPLANQNYKPFKCSRRFLPCLTVSAAISKENILSYKITEKPNEETNSQFSQQDVEDVQKLVGDGGNNACTSSMAGGEVNVICLRRAKPAWFSNHTILHVTHVK